MLLSVTKKRTTGDYPGPERKFSDHEKTLIHNHHFKIPKHDIPVGLRFFKSKSVSNRDIYSLQVTIGNEQLIIDNSRLPNLLRSTPMFLGAILTARGLD